MFESREYPGHYHYAAYRVGDEYSEETRRPMKASVLQGRLDLILINHSLDIADLKWREVPAAELPLSGERVLAGK